MVEKVKDLPGWVVDPNTRLITNTNRGEFLEFKAKREKSKRDKNLETRVAELERQVAKLIGKQSV